MCILKLYTGLYSGFNGAIFSPAAGNHLSVIVCRPYVAFLIPAEAGNLERRSDAGCQSYIRVANILRYAILSGAIAPGSRCRRWSELGDHFKVARIQGSHTVLLKGRVQPVASMSYSIRRRASLLPKSQTRWTPMFPAWRS